MDSLETSNPSIIIVSPQEVTKHKSCFDDKV